MKPISQAIAHPGLPIIFAEGFRDYKNRISGHSHASIALTDVGHMVRTETRGELTDHGIEFTIDDLKPDPTRAAGAYEMIKKMIDLAAEKTGVRINSSNYGILTGSSDSGAAALVTLCEDLLGLTLDMKKKVALARGVSETAYRSLIGGLSEYIIDKEGNIHVSKLKKASYFKDLVVYAIPFEMRRFSADDLHLRVTQHERYNDRILQVDVRLEHLHQMIDSNDMEGFLALMEQDAKTVHEMFSQMGMPVIKAEIKDAVNAIEQIRGQGYPIYWNVAGGSAVYAFTLKKHAKEVSIKLKQKGLDYRVLQVAEGASTMNSAKVV